MIGDKEDTEVGKRLRKKGERLNELDGRTWERYSISIWDIVKTEDENKLGHPAMFPLELCERLIEIYTKVGDVVLDPFAGSGSAVVAAKKLGRKGMGLDLNPDFVNLARKRLVNQKVQFQLKMGELVQTPEIEVGESEVHCDDAKNLLNYVKPDSVDLCITSPPYWNIHTRKRTADYKESRPYSALAGDLGNISDYNQFMNDLESIFKNVHTVLEPKKRCIIIVMDIRVLNKFIPFHIDVIKMMGKIGFKLEDIILWDRHKGFPKYPSHILWKN